MAESMDDEAKKSGAVQFSVVELLNDIKAEGQQLFFDTSEIQL